MKLSFWFLALFVQSLFIDPTIPWDTEAGKSGEACVSLDCIIAAYDLKICMDQSVNPCEDFYKFTCGKFLEDTVIPDDKSQYGVFHKVDDDLNENLKALLNGEMPCIGCPKFEGYLKDYYKSCMDTESIEKNGIQAMQGFLEKLGGWPLVDKSKVYDQDMLSDIIASLLKYNMMGLFKIMVDNDEKNSSVHITLMYQYDVTFPQEYYNGDEQKEKIDAYKKFIISTGKHLFKDSTDEQLKKGMNDIFNFEENLSKILIPPHEFRHEHQEKISLKELATKFTKIKMELIVKKLYEALGVNINEDEQIALYGKSYFDKLESLLQFTPERTVVNYLIWKLIDGLTITMPEIFQNDATEFNKVVYGTTEMSPRWKRCIYNLESEMNKPLGLLYVKKYFDKKAKEKIMKLIKEIKESFKIMINEVPWMQEDTKNKALEKLSKIKDRVAYPDYYDEEENLFNDIFDTYNPNNGNFLEKRLEFRILYKKDEFKKLRKPVDPNRPDMEVAVINAFYVESQNAIEFPAGILQWPFFKESLPMYLNFGGIGGFIGHEITHAFDDRGKKFDGDGNLLNWWKDEDEEEYKKASECFVEQYNKFTVEGINKNVNGDLTLGENIADNGGFKSSFRAYKNWVRENGEERKLHNLQYTPEQLFFISFGRLFCSKMRPETEEITINTGYHTPTQFRVIGTLMNMKEFSEAFSCNSNTYMNPSKKCVVW